MTHLSEYQLLAERTMKQGLTDKEEIISYAMCLAEETGEVVGIINKDFYSNAMVNMEDELGDMLWVLAAIATKYDLSLEEVAQRNLKKLKARFPDGWTADGGIR